MTDMTEGESLQRVTVALMLILKILDRLDEIKSRLNMKGESLNENMVSDGCGA